jgi:tetratricopeptide (TPR) repeat protein
VASRFTRADIEALRERTVHATSHFEVASAGKEAAEALFSRPVPSTSLSDLVPRWLGAMVYTGKYRDCINASDVFARQRSAQRTPAYADILLMRAKAFRNLGEHETAIETYRRSLTWAVKRRDEVAIGRCLMAIGKIYGNYLGQRGLASLLVEEALARFERELRRSRHAARRRILERYVGICYDAIGQAFRETDRRRALELFARAESYHRRANNRNGLCRVGCHIARVEYSDASPPMRERAIRHFREQLRTLMNDANEERGLGVRLVQYANMLHGVGRSKEARQCCEFGQRIAQRYGDFKTEALASIAYAELVRVEDRAESLRSLDHGRRIASERRLLVQELDANRRLAALYIDTSPGAIGPSGPIELLERNRQLLVNLVGVVHATLTQITTSGEQAIEFSVLSPSRRQLSRERFVVDFDQAVGAFMANAVTTSETLGMLEQRRQGLLVLTVLNSGARELVHELKHAVPYSGSPFGTVLEELEDVKRRLEEAAGLERASLEEVAQAVSRSIGTLVAVGSQMERLKAMLQRGLQRPRHLTEMVSLKAVCESVCRDLESAISTKGPRLSFKASCDVVLTSSADLIATVVKTLIRNAIEAWEADKTLYDQIDIAIDGVQIGDASVGNPAREPVLSILVPTASPHTARVIYDSIDTGLKGFESTKPFGSGVGLELASRVFEDLMRARLCPVIRGTTVGIEVGFREPVRPLPSADSEAIQ